MIASQSVDLNARIDRTPASPLLHSLRSFSRSLAWSHSLTPFARGTPASPFLPPQPVPMNGIEDPAGAGCVGGVRRSSSAALDEWRHYYDFFATFFVGTGGV